MSYMTTARATPSIKSTTSSSALDIMKMSSRSNGVMNDWFKRVASLCAIISTRVLAASLMYEVICAKSEKYCSSRGSSLANGISKTPAEFFWDDQNLDQSESGNITERRPDVHELCSSPFSLWEKGRG